ncbi:hypothetical protein [Aeoliella sp. SH292]|uniref:hypothetical protein n=1 Tax=Aeoliella sp. SH292 TaxID=3454464 RepID=UPI003F9731FA
MNQFFINVVRFVLCLWMASLSATLLRLMPLLVFCFIPSLALSFLVLYLLVTWLVDLTLLVPFGWRQDIVVGIALLISLAIAALTAVKVEPYFSRLPIIRQLKELDTSIQKKCRRSLSAIKF